MIRIRKLDAHGEFEGMNKNEREGRRGGPKVYLFHYLTVNQ